MYNFLITQNYFLETQTRLHMKLKLWMFIRIFGMIRINLTIATILKIIPILIKQTKKVIGKLKDETSSMAITHDQFVRLR